MQRTSYFRLFGGMDLVTSPIEMPPGRVIAGVNYEPWRKGYRRTDGFERIDGKPKPSEASYWVLNFDAGSAAISEGDTVTDGTSGATGKALIAAVVESGTYGGSDAAGYLVLTNVSGTFGDNNDLEVSAVKKAEADGTATEIGANNDTNHATWLQDAIETARALIGAVPGSGILRGVWHYSGTHYAFRNNAGGTACVMYKSTSSGWSAVDLGREIDFTSGGTTEIAENDTITGATSGATATVERVIVQSGSWAAGDAAGYLILSGQTGTFQAENLNVGASTNLATIAGNSSAITLSPSGSYEFVNTNFGGHVGTYRMYGCDGVNKAFEFDGSVYVPIRTGMTVDAPSKIVAHKKHLILGFAGGSMQNSSPGEPYDWSAVTGAAEIGIGQEITGFLSTAGILIVFGRNTVAMLYGSSSADWSLDVLTEEAGAIDKTVQNIGTAVYMDDRGLRTLRTTQAFGDFRLGSLSQLVEPIFDAKRGKNVTPLASVRVRSRDQYRLFWSDGTGLYVYFGRKDIECLPFDWGKTVYCACSAEDASGNEILLFGSDDGYVYQMDVGTSFDGEEVSAYARLAFYHTGSPTQNKRWHKATLEIDGGENTTLGMVAEFSYGDAAQPPSQQIDFDVKGSGGFWDEANWDEFYWSSSVEGVAEAHFDGIGPNMSIAIVTAGTYEAPHTIHGCTLHYSYRGLKR